MKAVRDHYARPTSRPSARRRDCLPTRPRMSRSKSSRRPGRSTASTRSSARASSTREAPGVADYGEIPSETSSLFKTTIAGTTEKLQKPWLLSVFSDNAGIVAFDDEDAFCIKVETHNSPSALDPYGGALTGIVGVNRDILGCGLGAQARFSIRTCFAWRLWITRSTLPDRLASSAADSGRRPQGRGARRQQERDPDRQRRARCSMSAIWVNPWFIAAPAASCPGTSAGIPCETKEILPGDRICMVGGRIGNDGIHGATFSSLAMDEASPVDARCSWEIRSRKSAWRIFCSKRATWGFIAR